MIDKTDDHRSYEASVDCEEVQIESQQQCRDTWQRGVDRGLRMPASIAFEYSSPLHLMHADVEEKNIAGSRQRWMEVTWYSMVAW